jgi:hypothetical protein
MTADEGSPISEPALSLWCYVPPGDVSAASLQMEDANSAAGSKDLRAENKSTSFLEHRACNNREQLSGDEICTWMIGEMLLGDLGLPGDDGWRVK